MGMSWTQAKSIVGVARCMGNTAHAGNLSIAVASGYRSPAESDVINYNYSMYDCHAERIMLAPV